MVTMNWWKKTLRALTQSIKGGCLSLTCDCRRILRHRYPEDGIPKAGDRTTGKTDGSDDRMHKTHRLFQGRSLAYLQYTPTEQQRIGREKEERGKRGESETPE